MYQAMMTAPLGDDVLGDDPTVRKLEIFAAQLLGKETAMFVPTGTMGNSICIKTQTREGDEILVEELSHVYTHEMSHLAVVSRVLPRPVRSTRGVMDLDDLMSKLSRRSMVSGQTALICTENTHNFWSGRVIPLDHLSAVSTLAREHNLKVHLDGARIFNAQAATGIPAAEYALHADTVMFCLSKGLAGPIGSIVAGPREVIEEGRYVRKMLGGGMRQAGLIAACGLVALETMIDRLAEDHVRAKHLAEELAQMPGVKLDPALIDTNIVIFALDHPRFSAEELVSRLAEVGIWALTTGAADVRFVTHKDVDDSDVGRAIEECGRLLRW
jgi:threonine aldolase